MTIVWVVAALALAFGALLWQRRNPYVISRAEVTEAIEAALLDRQDPADWEKLLRTPIKRDRYLNSVRKRLAAIPREPNAVAGTPLYSAENKTKISALLEALKRRGDGIYRE